jgi:hypothetical protein
MSTWKSCGEQQLDRLHDMLTVMNTQARSTDKLISILNKIHKKQEKIEQDVEMFNERFESLRTALLQVISEESKSIG